MRRGWTVASMCALCATPTASVFILESAAQRLARAGELSMTAASQIAHF